MSIFVHTLHQQDYIRQISRPKSTDFLFLSACTHGISCALVFVYEANESARASMCTDCQKFWWIIYMTYCWGKHLLIYSTMPRKEFFLALVPYLLALVPSKILLHSRPKWPCPKNYEIQGLTNDCWFELKCELTLDSVLKDGIHLLTHDKQPM